MKADTFGGTVHVEWDADAAATPLIPGTWMADPVPRCEHVLKLRYPPALANRLPVDDMGPEILADFVAIGQLHRVRWVWKHFQDQGRSVEARVDPASRLHTGLSRRPAAGEMSRKPPSVARRRGRRLEQSVDGGLHLGQSIALRFPFGS